MLSCPAHPSSRPATRLRRGRAAFSLFIIWLFSFLAHAGQELPYDVWRVEDDGQPSTVTSIVQSREGFLWIGTYAGLARFDGVRLVNFTSSQTPGLRSSRITSLYCDLENNLWIGHETGELTRFARGRFENVPMSGKWPGGAVEAIVKDELRDLWLLNDLGKVVRLRDALVLEVPGGASASRKAALITDTLRQLWICANGRVATVKNGQLVEQRFDSPSSVPFYERIAPAREGGLWISAGGQVRRWDNGRWVATAGQIPSDSAGVNNLLETRSGLLLAGTLNQGLYLLPPGSPPLHLGREQGLSHDWVRTLFEDHEGNLWVGSGGGLDVLRTRKVTMLEPPDNFRGAVLLSVTSGSQGQLWIGTEGAGLYRKSQEVWTRFDQTAGLSNVFVWSILETTNNEVLVGTWGGGLQQLEADKFVSPTEFSQITSPVVSLFEARDGTLWIGTTAGLWSRKDRKVQLVAGANELSFPDIRAIAQTRDGVIWFGMLGGGLGTVRDGQVTQIRKGHGLASDFIQALYPDPDGALWIGTSDNGLCRFKGGKFASLSAAQGMPVTVVTHIVDDGQGQLWIGSNRGIFRASKRDLNRCADGTVSNVTTFSFGRSEGLTSLTCSGGFQPGAGRTAEGLIFFPTTKGLATIDPSRVETNPVRPPVVIEEFLVGGRPVDWQHGEIDPAMAGPNNRLEIPPAAQQFEIRYTAPSFIAPEKVRFRHRLEGLEDHWSAPGTERSAPYSYLPPGDYVFRVIACNNDGLWNERGASLAFTVLPAFYQTWWFSSLSVVGGAGLVGALAFYVSRRRLRRHLEQLERQRALERERARIARDIHDDLGASLTRITLLSQAVGGELDDIHQARADVDQIYHTARDLTRAMDEIVWAVNPKHDTLDSLVTYLGRFAQNFMSTAGIRCRLDLPIDFPHTSLTSEIRHNVFLAFKEALNNVIKHAKATEVRVLLDLHADRFELTVVDNGCGFRLGKENADPPAGSERTRNASGNGLANMQRRLEEVGGVCEISTAPGEGTRVKFAIPLRPRQS